MTKKKATKRRSEFKGKMREYRRFLKNDFDYDYAYILRLLQYKLSRTRRCIVSNNIVVSAKKIGREIRKVEDLIGRVLKDDYYEKISKSFRKKYGPLRMVKLPRQNGMPGVPVTFRYQKETPKNTRQIHRESMKLHNRAERMKLGDLRCAFDLMQKNMWGWWD